MLTHKELCEKAGQYCLRNGYPVCFVEMVASGHENPDVLAFSSGSSVVIEVKTSRSDFKKDQEKWHRKNPEYSMGCNRYYYCVKDLIKQEELPENWGLIYYDPEINKSRIVKRSNDFKNCERAERRYMYSALRRIFEKPILRNEIKYFCKEGLLNE